MHAIDTHLLAAVEMGVRAGVPRIAVHGFLDGRDSPPMSGAEVVARLAADLTRIAGPRACIATLTGRYFAMDRDKRWDRTRLAYDAMVHGAGRAVTDPVQAVRDAYARNETDEFIKPLVLQQGGAPSAPIRRRRRHLLLQLSQRPDAPDLRRARDRRLRRGSTPARARGWPAWSP